ncbi:MAG: PilZ domain-containing protein [Pseudomonadota bacterium]|nr:PilZ domain-containing protein [Pseudomonadota bacterium]
MRREHGHIKRAPRVEGRHDALLVSSDGRQSSVVVLDLSGGGFRIQSDEMLKIGEYVALRVDRYGDFPAQIRWALAGEAGGVFLEPIVLPDE